MGPAALLQQLFPLANSDVACHGTMSSVHLSLCGLAALLQPAGALCFDLGP